MVTTTRVRFEADASQLNRELATINQRLQGVSNGFAQLKGAIAGLAIGNFISQALNAAAQINALSQSTGIAAQNIRGLQLAFISNGGSAEKANDALSDLTKNIGEAAAGSGELQKTFGTLGVSLDDLRTLSEQDILTKTIQGLAAINDNATRSALGMKLFGEATKTVDFRGVNSGLDGFVKQSRDVGGSSKAVADAQANVALAFARVADAIVKVAAPVATFIASIEDLGGKIKNVITWGLRIAVLVASFTLLGRIAAGVRAVFASMAVAAEGLQGILFSLSARLASGGKIAAVFADALAWLGRPLSYLLKTFPTLSGFVIQFGAAIKAAAAAAAAWFGINWAGDKIDEVAEAANRNAEAQAKANETGEATRAVQDAMAAAVKKNSDEIQSQVFALADLSAAYRTNIAQAQKQYELQTALIGASEQQRESAEMRLSAETAYLEEVNRLLEKYSEAQAKIAQGNAEAAQLLGAVETALVEVSQAYSDQVGAIDRLTQARARAQAQDQLTKFQTQEQIRLQGQLQRITDETAKLGMTELEQKYYDIAAAARDAARAAIQAEEARRGSPLSLSEQQAYYDRAQAGNEKLIRQTRELYDANERIKQQSRTFSAGWQEAWREYADAATNASQLAQNVFRTATKGMEDALVGFVKTGKFEWRSFVADILEQLLRAQIQQGIANLGQSLGLGDLFGSPQNNQSGAGRGATPAAPLYVQDVSSGLQGGGVTSQQAVMAQQTQSIFSRMGEVMSSIGSYMGAAMKSISGVIGSLVGSLSGIMGSVMKGMGSALSGIGNMIMGLVRSIVSMFGGYFADGGVLPRGKFGVVGERGPELITGPAAITPMTGLGGGSTQVIYNINAVDARSFQQLLASDPGLIFALTEQGRKSLAGSRR